MSLLSRKTFIQRSDERLDYDFDFTEFLGSDTITGNVVTVSPSGITVDLIEATTKVVKVWLKDGVSGTDYKIKCKVTTVLNKVKVLDCFVQVRDV